MRLTKQAVLAIMFAAASPAIAAPPPAPGYFGRWVITGAVEAPWPHPGFPNMSAEIRRLTGKAVIFARGAITGPTPLGCRGPHYEMKHYPPDMLYQGNLSDPARQAAALGFKPGEIDTLETGCEGAIDFHFVDADTTTFGLNNQIYTIRRRK